MRIAELEFARSANSNSAIDEETICRRGNCWRGELSTRRSMPSLWHWSTRRQFDEETVDEEQCRRGEHLSWRISKCNWRSRSASISWSITQQSINSIYASVLPLLLPLSILYIHTLHHRFGFYCQLKCRFCSIHVHIIIYRSSLHYNYNGPAIHV